jgi:mannose-6-phosphate isomerase
LTSKHIDVDQLIDIADFTEGPAFRIEAETDGAVTRYPAPLDECALESYAVDGNLDVEISGPSIAIVTEGEVTISAESTVELSRGRVVFIEAGDSVRSLSGRGNLIVARQTY